MPLKLRAARVNAGLTQKQVSEALNISRNTISNYEKYKTKPDIETAKQLAKLYGMDVDSIIFFAE